MEEKLRFVLQYDSGEYTMTELCQRFEIARETGYVWLRRYRQSGLPGLVERSRTAQRHPNQTPEAVERMETAQPPAANRRKQQQALDRFREEYNRVRPHEALQMQTPAAVYQPSPRTFPAQVPEPEYPETMLVRSVRRKGHFRWNKHDVFLSEVLWSERVGLLPEDGRWFTIYFAQYPIARFDCQELRVKRLRKTGRAGKTTVEEGAAAPSSTNPPLPNGEQKLSGMCPV